MQARFNSSKVSGPVIGIDLGTTNSCVAIMEGKVRIFLTRLQLRARLLSQKPRLAFFRLLFDSEANL